MSYDALGLEEALASFERNMIQNELARNDNNLSRAAQKLQISQTRRCATGLPG